MLLNPAYVDSDEAESDFYNLENMIVEYQQSPQGLTLDKSKINKELVEVIVENFNTTDLKKLCVALYHSNRHFSNAFDSQLVQKADFKDLLPALGCDSKVKYSFAQPLLEFSNALSHLVAFVYHSDKKDCLSNIDKAKNHIYRAALDNYKMILRFSIPNIKQKREEILHAFHSIREQEFLLIGERLDNKKITYQCPETTKTQKDLPILTAYKEFVKSIYKLHGITL